MKRNYGGAFDIDPESYFTKDDLVEFLYALNDTISDMVTDDWSEATEAYIDDDVLEVVVSDANGDEHVFRKRIDYRTVRRPQDLNKYVRMIITDMQNTYVPRY